MDVLVTGATGFVGAALVPRLLAAGHSVRCLVRDPERVDAPWRDAVQLVAGDAGSSQAVLRAADGTDAAYYLVHGMRERIRGLVDRERRLARAFADGVELAGVRRVVYLGGLADDRDVTRLSEHMYARQQAGVTLRQGPVPVTEVRAAVVVGAGSASFDLLLAAARSPVVLATPAAGSRCQPIAVDDLLDCLTTVVDEPQARIVEAGGPDVLTYAEMVAVVREELGAPTALHVPVPYLPPEATVPVVAAVARLDPALVYALLSSARSDAVVGGDPGRRWVGATGFRPAVRSALRT